MSYTQLTEEHYKNAGSQDLTPSFANLIHLTSDFIIL